MIIIRFKNEYLKEIYTQGKKRGKQLYDESVVKSFIRKVDILFSLNYSQELIQFKSLYFEFLKKELKGFCSIRVNEKYCIIFKIIKEKDGKKLSKFMI